MLYIVHGLCFILHNKEYIVNWVLSNLNQILKILEQEHWGSGKVDNGLPIPETSARNRKMKLNIRLFLVLKESTI